MNPPEVVTMEVCPECSVRLAASHMREFTVTKNYLGAKKQETRRICCVCVDKLTPKKVVELEQPKGRGWMGLVASPQFLALAVCVVLYLVLFVFSDIGPRLIRTMQGKDINLLAGPAVPKVQTSTLNLRSDLLFEFGKAVLKPEADPALREIAAMIRASPDAAVVIRGYTDSIGSETSNLLLSRQRAESVQRWFIANAKIASTQLAVEGMGAKSPVAPNTKPDGTDNPAGREQNRRVTITLTGVLATGAKSSVTTPHPQPQRAVTPVKVATTPIR